MTNENKLQYSSDLKENESLSLKRDLFRYLKYWKWILLGGIISLLIGFVYLRYAPRIYQTNAKIKILKKKESGLDLSGLSNAAPLFDMSTINLENEMEILKSRRIIGEVVDILNLNVFYYRVGRIKSPEIFGSETPIKIDLLLNNDLSSNNDFPTLKETFIYRERDSNSFNIKILDKDFNKSFKYGEEIVINELKFTVNKKKNFNLTKSEINENIYFQFKDRKSRVGSLISKIEIEQIGEDSEVLEMKLSGENVEKNEAILNNLISVFNQDGIEDDRQVALKTVQFVSNRLNVLESELDTVETNLVDFKRSSNFISENTGTGTLFSSYSESDKRRSDLQNQLEISKYLRGEIIGNNQYELLPGNVGIENNNINNLIADYNKSVLERNRKLTSSTEASPDVKEISLQLRSLNRNIEQSIDNYIQSIQISLQNISRRERQFNSDINELPENEKIAREIKRQQAVKENLYIFLLQKQIEADLSAAITAPAAKVVDYSHTPSEPVSPKTSVVYLASLVVGLAIPIGFLYIIYLFDTKVTSKEQVQAKLNIPIVAEIPVNKDYDGKIIKKTDNSNVAEAFRILRTNINYLLPDHDSKAKVIFSTSSIKGEGKTFCAVNLAAVSVSNNSKTLLIGSDLRNPQLHNYLGVSKKNIGLSSYLTDQNLTLKDVIFKNEKNLDFDIVLSGEIPPNPSEILNNGRLEDILDEAREIYDIIIVDTAPTLLVTDTLSIVEQADLIIYMIRANYTELKILRHIKEMINFNMQKKVGIGINAIDEKKGYEYNYGYGYGYGVDTKIKKWYNF